jgi:phytoene dehydrogenase-like protein
MTYEFDAVVVGSGPNGLAAAITLQQQGLSVKLMEAKTTIGGGMRSEALTAPGFTHDVCSAIHPLAAYSPFFQSLPLQNFGLQWIHPEVALAHPFPDGMPAILNRSLDKTGDSLDVDKKAYIRLLEPLLESWDQIGPDILGPLKIPRHPVAFAKFALLAFSSAKNLANVKFKGKEAKGLFAGLAAHSIRPLNQLLTSGVGLVLAVVGHKIGWPFPRGGTQFLADALAAYFISIGGKIETSHTVQSYKELEFARIKLMDLTPRQILNIKDLKFLKLYEYQLSRYRYGPGIFKIDYALNEAIPFKAKDCNKAGTVHIGGTIEEIAEGEKMIWKGKHSEKPFLLLSQQSLFDTTRAPQGKHTAWVYCHTPAGSTSDMTTAIEQQIELYAPGFKDIILQKKTFNTIELEAYNPNYIGGDITGGVTNLRQLYTRPALRISPYTTPHPDVYICSSSTPPGAGVHGMCGYHAAKKVLKDHFNTMLPELLSKI